MDGGRKENIRACEIDEVKGKGTEGIDIFIKKDYILFSLLTG